jgi:hypothetical protein
VTAPTGTAGADAESQLTTLGAPSDVASQFADLDALPTPDSSRIQTLCAKSSGSGGKVVMYGCDTTFKVGVNSSGTTWYLEDRFQASLSSYGDPITALKFGVGSYSSGNEIDTWSPGATEPYASAPP